MSLLRLAFQKAPPCQAAPGASWPILFTVCTDLGDIGFEGEVPIEVNVVLRKYSENPTSPGSVLLEKSLTLEPYYNAYQGWKVDLTVPDNLKGSLSAELQVAIEPKGELDGILGCSRRVGEYLVLPVYSKPINIVTQTPKSSKRQDRCERICRLPLKNEEKSLDIIITEACQDKQTLGTRLWDAAIVMSEYLTVLSGYIESTDRNTFTNVTTGELPATPYEEILSNMDLGNMEDWQQLRSTTPTINVAATQWLINSLNLNKKKSHLNVIELGCGCGLVGLSLSRILEHRRIHKAQILLTDLSEVLPVLECNVRRTQGFLSLTNNSGDSPPQKKSRLSKSISVGMGELSWGEEVITQTLSLWKTAQWTGGNTSELPTVDLVLAADVAYNSSSHSLLLETMSTLAQSRKTAILIGFKPRVPEMEKQFFARAQEKFHRTLLYSHLGLHVFMFQLKE
ncbi:hypothetical protein K493DRAFT_306838 [Basidiobolus meristosporus CBS 931.73]|uniref:Uncharacterized protein n=1 Tax=Basidiobolus meristosporus CBS 931.73 TaxID=1314790 RepID=A0A1Y1XPS5_9FUNG|nr:hypothetical protein K493DRAFT_306838 [Basidiobolus meristosporus CBS 931.73]|eukprot:ORX87732.1 hypothetical protein K493DRAFT_306838 [Basidiobolus meristosporus CBS 931.73]